MENTDPIQIISNLEAKFNKIIVPENELPTISSNELKEKKSELEILKEQLLTFEKDNKFSNINSDNAVNTSFIFTKTENIIEKIILEIKLYEHFINKSENRLTLDEILKESNDLPEEYVDDIQSLTSSKIQSYFNNNLQMEASQSICSSLSLSSPLFKRNILNSYYNGPPKSISKYRRNSESNPHAPSKSNISYGSIKMFGNQMGNSMPPGPSDIFQWTKLRTISEQLYSKRIKDEIGMPTVFCIRKYIVFGMSNGAVLVYDLNQNLKVMFGFQNEGVDISPVTSIAISPDNTYIASGHQNGKITIWDIEQSTKVKEILPLNPKVENKKIMHQENSTITFIDFISSFEIISTDNKGMVFYHLIQKILMIYYVTTTKLYGLERILKIKEDITPILSLSVLSKGNTNHPIEDTNLVAISTTEAITVFSIKQETTVQFCDKWNKNLIYSDDKTEPVTCSCISWYPALKTEKSSNIKSNDPLLAYSYNNNLSIVRISKQKFTFKFISIGSWKAKHNITLIRWLNTEYVILMDNQENLIIFDVKLMNSVEKSDVCKRQILCQSINALSSKLNFEAVYHYSVQSFKGRLCVLCRSKFYIVSLFSWEERISTLIRSGNIVEAISIAIDFYKNSGKYAVMNLPTNDKKRMLDTGEYIEKLLVSYVNMTLVVPVDYEYINPEMSDMAVYQHLSHICFEVCITINRFDLLYGHIYDKFSECHLQDIFFETLEIYILNHEIDKLYSENDMNPSISEAFINYFYEKKWYSRLEECIILIDPTLLNIDHIIKIFRDKKLFKGLIYIYSHVLKDFISPIIEILMDLIEAKENGSNQSIDQDNYLKLKTHSENNVYDIKNELKGYEMKENLRAKSESDINKRPKEKNVKIVEAFTNNINNEEDEIRNTKKISIKKKKDVEYMLYVFIAYSLSGKSFPFGLPNTDNAKEAKIQCYNFLFSKNYIKWQYRKEYKDIVIGTAPYPYLKELLKRNTSETLKVLGAAFEDTSMNEEIILDPDYLKIDKDTSLIRKTHQFMTNNDLDYVDFNNADKSIKKINYQYIIHILFNIIDTKNEFSNYEQLQFYEFISRMISKFSTFIYLEEDILEKIYNFLLTYKEDEYYIRMYNDEHFSSDDDLKKSTLFVNSLGLTVWESRDIRQQSIQSILSIYNPPESEEVLIKKYKNAKYYRLCENIYIKNKDFAKVIECYLFDRYRQKDVYQCIFEILHLSTSYTQTPSSKSDINMEYDVTINVSNPDIINYSHLSSDQLNDIKKVITENVEKLLRIDCKHLAYVIILLFPSNVWYFLYQKLTSNDLQYRFLKSILQIIFDLGPIIRVSTNSNNYILDGRLNNINSNNNSQNSKDYSLQPKEVTFSSDIIEITPKLSKMNNKKIKKKIENEFTMVTMNSSTNYTMIQEWINYILCFSFYKKGIPEYISSSKNSKGKEEDTSEETDSNQEYQITSPFLLFQNDINEEYIELMCRYEPEQVITYLQFIDKTYKTYFYSTKKISEICHRYNVVDANSWIMEKSGDINKALDCFLEYIEEQFNQIGELLKNLDRCLLNKDNIHYTIYGEIEEERLKPQIKSRFEIIDVHLEKAIDLCRRAIYFSTSSSTSTFTTLNPKVKSKKKHGKQSKTQKQVDHKILWYKIFKAFVNPYCEFKKYVIDENSPIIKEIKIMEEARRKKSMQKITRFIEEQEENKKDKGKEILDSEMDSMDVDDSSFNVENISYEDDSLYQDSEIIQQEKEEKMRKNENELTHQFEIESPQSLEEKNLTETREVFEKSEETKKMDQTPSEFQSLHELVDKKDQTNPPLSPSRKASYDRYKVIKYVIIDIWKDINLSDTLQAYLKKILNNMIGYISFPKLIVKLLSEEQRENAKYGELKEIILLIIEMYNFELNLLQSVSKITMEDISHDTYHLNQDLHKAIQLDGHYCHLCHKTLILHDPSLTVTPSLPSPPPSPPPSPSIFTLSPSDSNDPTSSINLSPITSSENKDNISITNSNINNSNNNNNNNNNNEDIQSDSVIYFNCGHCYHKSCLYNYVTNHSSFFSKLYTLNQEATPEPSISNGRRNSTSSRGSFSSIGGMKFEKSPFWLKLCPACEDEKLQDEERKEKKEEELESSLYQSSLIRNRKKNRKKNKRNPYLPQGDETNLLLTLPYNNLVDSQDLSLSMTSTTEDQGDLTSEQKMQKRTKGKLGFFTDRILKKKGSNSSVESSSKFSLSLNLNHHISPFIPKNHIKKEISNECKEQQITSLDQFELLTNSVPKYEILSEIEYCQNKNSNDSQKAEGDINPRVRNKMKQKALPPLPKSHSNEDQDFYWGGEGGNNNDAYFSSKPTESSSTTKDSSNYATSSSNLKKSKSASILISSFQNYHHSSGNSNNNNITSTYHSFSQENLLQPPTSTCLNDPNYVLTLLDTNKKSSTFKLKLAPPSTPPSSSFLFVPSIDPTLSKYSNISGNGNSNDNDNDNDQISVNDPTRLPSPLSMTDDRIPGSPASTTISLPYSENSYLVRSSQTATKKKNKGKQVIP